MRAIGGTTTRIHSMLPIFRMDDGHRVLLYTPGIPVQTTRAIALEVERVFAGRPGGSAEADVLAHALERRAAEASDAWRRLGHAPFEPECLTLYLSNQCNLACGYCYAKPVDTGRANRRWRLHHDTGTKPEFPVLSEDTIVAAARLVARHSAAKGKPLTVVFHGGGEPTMHWDVLVRAWEACHAEARAAGIPLWTYVATHGVMTEDHARWLAGHVNLIGLSCDGPPDVQLANRPAASGADTSPVLERTARVFREQGVDFVVRVTVLPAAAHRQVELINYICDQLSPTAIRLEPAYDGRHGGATSYRPEDAPVFVAHFLDARDVARARGCDLQLSGVRIGEIHGPHCNPSREVLQLTPDGAASACFLSVGNDAVEDEPFVIGGLDPATGLFTVDHERVAAGRRRATRIPARCERCHNVYHCARDCPDSCLLESDAPAVGEDEGGFRCQVQKLVGRHDIWMSA